MDKRTLWALALVVVWAASLTGCCFEPNPATPEPAVAPPPKAPPKPMPKISPCGPVGMATAHMTLPAGDKACGVVRIERSAPKQVVAGAEFDYVIKLINVTKADLKGVKLREKLVTNLELVGTNPKSTITGGTLEWVIGELKAGESKLFTVRGKAQKPGQVVGCASVVFDMPEVCLSTMAVQPSIAVVKTGPAEAILCDVLTYKIVVKNNGSGPACNVMVKDSLPEGLTTVDGKKLVTFSAGDLNPGQAREFTFQAKAAKKGKFTNTATASADHGLAATSAPVTTAVLNPELKVVKTGPALRYIGRPGTYEIVVTNNGDADARNTVLTDTIPATTTLVAAEGAKVTGNIVVWALGTIKPGQSKKASLTLKFNETGAVRNVASAAAYCASASASVATEVKGIPAILLECIDLDDPIEIGSMETYQITVTNQGSAVGTNIVITCTLPAEQEFASAVSPTKETVKGKSVTFAPLATLAPKARAVYKVTVKCLKAGDVRFGVSLKSDQMDSPATETESTHIYGGD